MAEVLRAVVVNLNGVEAMEGSHLLWLHSGPHRVRQYYELPVSHHHIQILLIRQLPAGILPAGIAGLRLPRPAQADDVGALVAAVFQIMLHTGEQQQLFGRQFIVGQEDVVVRHGQKIISLGRIQLCQLQWLKIPVGNRGMAVGIALQPDAVFRKNTFSHSHILPPQVTSSAWEAAWKCRG